MTAPSGPTDWAGYERAKAAWSAAHPDAAPAEYEAAIRRIAREFGV